jgi:hypothetical protein
MDTFTTASEGLKSVGAVVVSSDGDGTAMCSSTRVTTTVEFITEIGYQPSMIGNMRKIVHSTLADRDLTIT